MYLALHFVSEQIITEDTAESPPTKCRGSGSARIAVASVSHATLVMFPGSGLAGVSRLLGLMAITELQNLQRFLSAELTVEC